MKKITNQELLKDMSPFTSNPLRAISLTFSMLEDLTDGKVRMVEASNPIAYLAEVSAVNVAAAVSRAEVLTRKIYPEMIRTEEDLYRHMADPDYLNRFSKPATMIIGVLFSTHELMNLAVPVHDGSGAKMLIIPKHSFFTLAGNEFCIQYPIRIRVLHNGTFNIAMDFKKLSPMYVPSTNMLTHETTTIENDKYTLINIPVQQVSLRSHLLQITSFSGFSKTLSFTDKFFFARAFVYSELTKRWTEAKITHNSTIYDPQTPTVCLQVLNGSVKATIPQIYFDTNRVRDAVRLDIYTTKGEQSIDYGDYDVGTFKLKFQCMDNIHDDTYQAPLGRLANMAIIPRTPLKGGSGPITFAQMHRRLIRRSATVAGLPITSNQLSQNITDTDFELITQIDDVTDRQYIVTRAVDRPLDKSTSTGLGACISIVDINMSELAAYNGQLYNSKRVSLKAETLMESTELGIHVVPKNVVDDLKLLAINAPDALANIVNKRQFFFSPYVYVMDDENNKFNMRPYHMSSPSIMMRTQFNHNDSIGLYLSSDEYVIVPNNTGDGYLLLMTVLNNESLGEVTPDQLHVQMSYLTGSSGRRAYLAGSLISKIDVATGRPVDEQWIYQFEIKTDFDIDSEHRLAITSTGYPVDLLQDVDITFILQDYRPPEAFQGDIDSIISIKHINNYNWQSFYIGATQERISIQFGEYLDHLWRRSRSIEETIRFKTYDEDEPARYPDDLYKTNSDGSLYLEIDRVTGTTKRVKLHSAGEVILVDGEPQVKHKKGSIVYVNGKPVPLKHDVGISRQVDLFLVDGRYYFANNPLTRDYLDTSINQITSWCVNDLPNIQLRGLEETKFYYHPRQNTGLIDVMVDDGSLVRARSDQALKVTYRIRRDKYENGEIVSNIMSTTAKTISDAIESIKRVSGAAISKNDIVGALKAIYRDDIIDVELYGWMDGKHDVILISDVSSIPSLGKKLEAQSNLSLRVVDDVSIEFEKVDSVNQTMGKFSYRRD